MDLWLLPLGALAGLLTTLAGLGGGLLLVGVLGLVSGPHVALALSSPALLLSNLHRVIALRAQLDHRVVAAIALGAVPGAVLGGLLLPSLPPLLVTLLVLGSVVLALLRVRGVIRLELGRPSLSVAGAGVGALAATSGGAGLLVAPLVLSAGLSGTAYVATVSSCAVALQLGRVVGYGASGLLTAALLPRIALLVVGLVLGNLIGVRLRGRIGQETGARLELGSLLVATASVVAGALR